MHAGAGARRCERALGERLAAPVDSLVQAPHPGDGAVQQGRRVDLAAHLADQLVGTVEGVEFARGGREERHVGGREVREVAAHGCAVGTIEHGSDFQPVEGGG